MQILVDSGLKMTDHNIDDEGYEVEISAFKVNLYTYHGQWRITFELMYTRLMY